MTNCCCFFTADFSDDTTSFSTTFSLAGDFCADMGEVIEVPIGEYYEGPYVVAPQPDADLILPTDRKAMSDDMTFLKIPYAEAGNEAGGNTVTIG